MAKLKYGAVVTDSRGSIGGMVFSRDRFGAVARQKTQPRAASSTARTLVQAGLANLSQRWGTTLSQSQRNAWEALATSNPVTDVFGNSHALSGMQLYVRCNQLRRQVGLAYIDTAPGSQATTALATMSLTVTTAPLVRISYTATPLGAGDRLYIRATPPLSPGIGNVSPYLAFCSFSGLAQASTYTFTSDYTAKFGSPITGRAISVEVRTMRDANGKLSTALTAKVTV